jgi:hypothetical protein
MIPFIARFPQFHQDPRQPVSSAGLVASKHVVDAAPVGDQIQQARRIETAQVVERGFEQGGGAGHIGFDKNCRRVDRPVDMAFGGDTRPEEDTLETPSSAPSGRKYRRAKRWVGVFCDTRQVVEIAAIIQLADSHNSLAATDQCARAPSR